MISTPLMRTVYPWCCYKDNISLKSGPGSIETRLTGKGSSRIYGQIPEAD